MFFVLVTRDQLGGVEELPFIRNPITRPRSLDVSTSFQMSHASETNDSTRVELPMITRFMPPASKRGQKGSVPPASPGAPSARNAVRYPVTAARVPGSNAHKFMSSSAGPHWALNRGSYNSGSTGLSYPSVSLFQLDSMIRLDFYRDIKRFLR